MYLRRRLEGARSNAKQLLHSTQRLHADRQRAIGLAARFCREAIGDFGLYQENHSLGKRRGKSRSEERRVGKEGRSRWSPYHLKKKKIYRMYLESHSAERL